MTEQNKADILERIKIIREHHNMNLSQFARKIRMKQNTFHSQDIGVRSLSLVTVFNTLNTFRGVSSDWLLFGKGQMLRNESLICEQLEVIQTIQETFSRTTACLEKVKIELYKLQ